MWIRELLRRFRGLFACVSAPSGDDSASEERPAPPPSPPAPPTDADTTTAENERENESSPQPLPTDDGSRQQAVPPGQEQDAMDQATRTSEPASPEPVDEEAEDWVSAEDEPEEATGQDGKQEVSVDAEELAALEAAMALARFVEPTLTNDDHDQALRVRYPYYNELLEFTYAEDRLDVVVGVPESVCASLVMVRYSSDDWKTIGRANGQVCFRPGTGGGRVMVKFSIPCSPGPVAVCVNLFNNARDRDLCCVTTLRVCGSPCTCLLLDDFRYRLQTRV